VDILLGLLAFVLLPAGAISLLILVSKAIARMVNGPTPADPNSPPTLRHAYTIVILVTLTVMGVLSFAALYVIGSALASL
jgi:hypothetical protein